MALALSNLRPPAAKTLGGHRELRAVVHSASNMALRREKQVEPLL